MQSTRSDPIPERRYRSLGCGVEDLHKDYFVLLSGRLDSLELPADDGSHICELVVVVTTFGIINDVPV